MFSKYFAFSTFQAQAKSGCTWCLYSLAIDVSILIGAARRHYQLFRRSICRSNGTIKSQRYTRLWTMCILARNQHQNRRAAPCEYMDNMVRNRSLARQAAVGDTWWEEPWSKFWLRTRCSLEFKGNGYLDTRDSGYSPGDDTRYIRYITELTVTITT